MIRFLQFGEDISEAIIGVAAYRFNDMLVGIKRLFKKHLYAMTKYDGV